MDVLIIYVVLGVIVVVGASLLIYWLFGSRTKRSQDTTNQAQIPVKLNKVTAILGFLAFELLAVLGALPLICVTITYQSFYYHSCHAFWEDNEIPLGAFLAIVLGIVLFYTRHQSIRIQASAVLVVIGLLVLTIFVVREFI